jgi:hypothetical protein
MQLSSNITSLLSAPWHRAAMSALKFAGGRLMYGPRQWVPDEYEVLERAGLVRCEFGRSDIYVDRLREREISLTQAGVMASSNLDADSFFSGHVEYSFRSALERSAINQDKGVHCGCR